MQTEGSVIDYVTLKKAVGRAVLLLAAALAPFAFAQDLGQVIPTRFARANAAVFDGAARAALPFLAVCLYCIADWQSGLTSAFSGARGAQFTCFHQRRSRAR